MAKEVYKFSARSPGHLAKCGQILVTKIVCARPEKSDVRFVDGRMRGNNVLSYKFEHLRRYMLKELLLFDPQFNTELQVFHPRKTSELRLK